MRGILRLSLVVGEAALTVTTAWFALALVAFHIFGPSKRPAVPTAVQATALALVVLVPIAVAAWWVFRRLQIRYTRNEARVTTITFVIFTPMSMLIAILFGQILGSYADLLLGRHFGLIGAFAGTVLITAFLSFVACALVLWVVRRIKRIEQSS